MNDTCFPEGPENDPRFDIIKDFVRKHNFKFSAIGMKLRNKDYKNIKDIFDEITKELDEDMSISEKCWNIFNPNQRPEYKDDKKPKFRNFKDGYVGYHTNNIPSSKRKGGYTPIDYSSLSEDQISELKNEFLNKTKEILDNDPDKRHFSSSIKKNKNLLDDIMYHTKFLDEDCSFSERVYSYMNDYSNENIICKYGNKFTFIGYNFGYRGGCGRASSCKCVSEKVSKSVSNTKSTFTKERNQEINEKRNQTVLEKSGGEYCNNGQSPTAKKKHREFYDDKEKVRAQVEKQENTCMEKYGVTNASKLPETKIKKEESCMEKYGVKNYNQKHISAKNIEILEDPKLLNEIYQKEGSIRTSEILGVHSTLINKKVKEYNLEKNIVNSGEREIYEFLKEIGIKNIIQNSRPLDGKEIDLLCKDYNFAIEFNGNYWHSDQFKEPNYHKDKTDTAIKLGYNIIQIFEDEWKNSKDIIKNIIKNKLNLSDKRKINARDCSIKEVNPSDARIFLDKNHIQGFSSATYHYGLYTKDNELVALMSFRKNNKFNDKNIIELSRFASSEIVRGGASKLFNHFVKNHLEYDKVISYADKRWSNGDLYHKLNFKLDSEIPINYYYYHNSKRYNKENFRKEDLKKMFNLSDDELKNKTENEITKENGIYKIYDCGKLKFIWYRKTSQ